MADPTDRESEFATIIKPDIRWDVVSEIRRRISRGEYETPEKLEIAVSRLLTTVELGERL